ncbi:hypothetical protein BH11ACT4_BH11ACT4_02670 [soil metagenome]
MDPDDSDLIEYTDLPQKDQVALWAGRVVRKEAQIESMLRTIYYELCGRGLSWAVVPTNFAPLMEAVRTMLKASPSLPEDYVADCLAVLDKLKLAHQSRNRVVHDQWVEHDQSPGTFVSAAKGVTDGSKPEITWDLPEFRKVYIELRFLYAQVAGIFWSIGSILTEDERDMFTDMLPSNREGIAGRIDLTGETTWTFTDPKFVERLNAEYEKRSEAFKKRWAEMGLGNY